MKLAENFSLEEFIQTKTGLFNDPGPNEIKAIISLVNNVLQPARNLYGKPMRINSGFRSPAVNQKIGGVLGSQHCKGEAADISCDDNKALFDIIRKIGDFDQLIWEFGNNNQPEWIHVSYNSHNRRNVMKSISVKGNTIYKSL
jgi:zinc D-Ala-D-Ala carboxypeptidase